MALISTPNGVVDVEQVGVGPDLVLLHSLLTERSAYDRVRPMLAKRYRLSLVNLPGYGQSAPTGNSIEDYADQVAAVLPKLGLTRPITLLGNGLGGFVSMAFAIRHGEAIDRLVIVDALAGFQEASKGPLRVMAASVKERGMDAALDTAIRRMFPPAYIAAHPEVVEERKGALRQMDPGTFAKLCLALTQVDFHPQLGSIRNKTLVMAGSQDATTAPELVRKLSAGIPGGRFVEIPGCGHCPQIENPDLFVNLLDTFLSEG